MPLFSPPVRRKSELQLKISLTPYPTHASQGCALRAMQFAMVSKRRNALLAPVRRSLARSLACPSSEGASAAICMVEKEKEGERVKATEQISQTGHAAAGAT